MAVDLILAAVAAAASLLVSLLAHWRGMKRRAAREERLNRFLTRRSLEDAVVRHLDKDPFFGRDYAKAAEAETASR